MCDSRPVPPEPQECFAGFSLVKQADDSGKSVSDEKGHCCGERVSLKGALKKMKNCARALSFLCV